MLATGHSAGALLGKLWSSRGQLLAHHRSKGKLEHLRETSFRDFPRKTREEKYFRKERRLTIALRRRFVRQFRTVKKSATTRAGSEPIRVVAVGDTIIGEQGLVAIIGRDPRYHVCGAANTFDEANNSFANIAPMCCSDFPIFGRFRVKHEREANIKK